MGRCEECGSDRFDSVIADGVSVQQCALCDAITGDDAAVAHVLTARAAREAGIDPAIYPLVTTLGEIAGLRVVVADGGNIEALTWPFVHLDLGEHGALAGVENLTKSLALGARLLAVHWVLEIEYQSRLILALKPRFHRDVSSITPSVVRGARADLQLIHRHLRRDMALSWWQH